MRPSAPPPPPAQAADFRANAPLELDRAGVCCKSGHFLWIVSSPGGFSSPDRLFLLRPPFPPLTVFPPFFWLWGLLCVALWNIGAHRRTSRLQWIFTSCVRVPVFIARDWIFVRYCAFSVSCSVVAILVYGMNEHVLVMPAVV